MFGITFSLIIRQRPRSLYSLMVFCVCGFLAHSSFSTPEPWPQPHPIPLGWTSNITQNQHWASLMPLWLNRNKSLQSGYFFRGVDRVIAAYYGPQFWKQMFNNHILHVCALQVSTYHIHAFAHLKAAHKFYKSAHSYTKLLWTNPVQYYTH